MDVQGRLVVQVLLVVQGYSNPLKNDYNMWYLRKKEGQRVMNSKNTKNLYQSCCLNNSFYYQPSRYRTLQACSVV